MSTYKPIKATLKEQQYKAYISRCIADELKKRGATAYWLKRLAKTAENLPKQPGLEIDTSDNALSFAGYPVSFLRNHKEKTLYLFAPGEAVNMDITTGKASIQFRLELLDNMEDGSSWR